MSVVQLLSRRLDTNGDGTGAKNARDAASPGSPATYYIQPPTEEEYIIRQLVVHIEDVGICDYNSYGGVDTLANGILIDYSARGVDYDLLDGDALVSLGDWTRVCPDVNVRIMPNGNDFATVLWDFAEFGRPIALRGEDNDRIRVRLRDDLSGLVSHFFTVQGQRLA